MYSKAEQILSSRDSKMDAWAAAKYVVLTERENVLAHSKVILIFLFCFKMPVHELKVLMKKYNKQKSRSPPPRLIRYYYV